MLNNKVLLPRIWSIPNNKKNWKKTMEKKRDFMATEWILSSNSMDCVSLCLLLCCYANFHSLEYLMEFNFGNKFSFLSRDIWGALGAWQVSLWMTDFIRTVAVIGTHHFCGKVLVMGNNFLPSSWCLLWKRQLLKVFWLTFSFYRKVFN